MISTTTESPDLGLKGKGVEPPSIPSIDKALKQYVLDEDAETRASLKAGESADKLCDEMHKHADKLRKPDGSLVYKHEDRVVSITLGNEKLKVKKIGEK